MTFEQGDEIISKLGEVSDKVEAVGILSGKGLTMLEALPWLLLIIVFFLAMNRRTR